MSLDLACSECSTRYILTGVLLHLARCGEAVALYRMPGTVVLIVLVVPRYGSTTLAVIGMVATGTGLVFILDSIATI